MACFKTSCLSRVRKLEMIAFKCTELPGKEGAATGDALWQGETSHLAHACPSPASVPQCCTVDLLPVNELQRVECL